MKLVLGNEHKVGENDGMLPMSLRDHEHQYMGMREHINRKDRECRNEN